MTSGIGLRILKLFTNLLRSLNIIIFSFMLSSEIAFQILSTLNLHSLCSESISWSLKSDCIQTTSMLLWIVLQKFTKRFRSNFITLTSYTRDIKANSIFYFRLNSLKLQRMHHPIILKTIHRALYRAMTTASPVAGSTVHAAPRPQPR